MEPTRFYREALVDNYRSFIWTERYLSGGSFELVVDLTRNNRTQLAIGTRCGLSTSDRVMQIESTEEIDGKTLTVRGRSIESVFLLNRPAFAPADGSTLNPWILSGTPDQIMRDLFAYTAGANALWADNKIPRLVADQDGYFGALPVPPGNYSIEISRTSVYEALKQIAEAYRIGFRLRHTGGNVAFGVYMGNNRSSAQTTFPAVIFSKELNTLINTRLLMSDVDRKTVAWLWSKNQFHAVATNDVEVGPGFDRRVMFIDATDLEMNQGPAQAAVLQQRGLSALAKQTMFLGFDGEIPNPAPYRYGVDYFLGDLVEYRDDFGRSYFMTVTEQIFSSDVNGDRSFPTLSTNTTYQAGTWAGWDQLQIWPNAPGTWSTF